MLKKIKRILCPVDIYDFQPEAAEYAITLANALDAEIIVVYAMEPLPVHYYDDDGAIPPLLAKEDEVKRKAEVKLAKILCEFFTPRAGKGEVVLGQAADQIDQIAKEHSTDMIIMASHGRSGFDRIIHGSVTNKVLANTKIPVLVVQPKQR